MYSKDHDVSNEAEVLPSEGLPHGEIVLGELSGIDENGQPLVCFCLEKRYGPIVAMATVPITAQHIGRQVGLLFAQTPDKTPVIVGAIYNAFHSLLENMEIAESSVEDDEVFQKRTPVSEKEDKNIASEEQVVVDGKKVLLEGKEEVVLRCGDSSITLHKSGKISIRGKYLLNRSTGVNRIMGGSVQVN